MSVAAIAAIVALLAWLWLAVLRGGFWRSDQRLPADTGDMDRWPAVVAVIPARNEAATIARTVASLSGQDYAGSLAVVVVDDESGDGTAAAARSADARIAVIRGAPLRHGWVGKVWAQSQGIAYADVAFPDAEWLLLTDADIVHAPDAVRRLVAHGVNRNCDLVSLMVRLRCRSFWERFLIPAFVLFFQKLYPFPWVNDPARRTAAAAGGCMLVRRSALTAAGGIEAIRARLIDDCALAARIKKRGAVWLGLADQSYSLRAYDRLGDVWTMVARTAYTQLHRSAWLLAGTVLGMLWLYLWPPVAALYGLVALDVPAALAGLAAWFLMAVLAWPTARYFGLRPAWGLSLPAAAMLYTAMTVDSARRHWQGTGGAWKGRHYGAAEAAGG